MRIRKNSRLINGRSSSTSLLVCHLNRSPWDIDAFSSQGEWEECSFTRNGSMLDDSSGYSGESIELSFEYMPPELKQENNESLHHEEDEIAGLDDGRVEYGSGLKHSTLYDYRYLTSSCHVSTTAAKKKKVVGTTPPVPPPAPKRRGRPRKVVEGVGYKTMTTNNQDNNRRNGDNVSEDDVEINKDEMKRGYIETVIDEELDYIESEEEEIMGGGRRVRKPIKARSLKSLM